MGSVWVVNRFKSPWPSVDSSTNYMADAHGWSLSSRCEDLLAVDIKSREQEIKQMGNDKCQFVFSGGRDDAMDLYPSAELAFSVRGTNTMWLHCICALFGYTTVQLSHASYLVSEHLDYCLSFAYFRSLQSCHISWELVSIHAYYGS